jgi:hypothetical protein
MRTDSGNSIDKIPAVANICQADVLPDSVPSNAWYALKIPFVATLLVALYDPFPYEAPDIAHSLNVLVLVVILHVPSEGGHNLSVVVKFETVNLL